MTGRAAGEVWAVDPPTPQALVAEWDGLAARRRQEILGGVDFSFSETLAPAVMLEVASARSRYRSPALVDIGCGTGELTADLQELADEVVGIDPSGKSIDLAQKLAPNLRFLVSDVESFAAANSGCFDIAVANMVLMNTGALDEFMRSVAALLRPGGTFIATVIHPWTWSRYWDYEQAPWYTYEHEVFVRARWKISSSARAAADLSTHVHRPIAAYFEAVNEAGLAVVTLRELGETSRSRSGRDLGRPFPRFLLLSAVGRTP